MLEGLTSRASLTVCGGFCLFTVFCLMCYISENLNWNLELYTGRKLLKYGKCSSVCIFSLYKIIICNEKWSV